MVDIISKKSGPRREDVAARRLINENRATIEGLANQLSSGQYARRHERPAPPKLSGLILHDLGGGAVEESDHDAYVRVSVNGRVVLVDGGTNKQLHYLGEIRQKETGLEFVLGTRKNGFFAPLDEEVATKLSSLDRCRLDENYGEDELKSEIFERLNQD